MENTKNPDPEMIREYQIGNTCYVVKSRSKEDVYKRQVRDWCSGAMARQESPCHGQHRNSTM